MSEPILLEEREAGVVTLIMNRPAALNALSRALRAEIVSAFNRLSGDDEVRAVVLTGAGRAFTAGVDLKEASAEGFALGADGGELDLAAAILAFPWPVIGAINGFAITGGFELALLCDVLIASDKAKFADTHARVGIMPGWGLSQRLPRLIGVSRAKEMSFTGNFVDAATAERWGLVNRVVSAEELVPHAQALAADMASCDPVVLRKYKAVIADGLAMPFGEALQMEIQRSQAHAATLTNETLEANRQRTMARGREKSGT